MSEFLEDIRIKQITPKTYSLTELREYHGPEIDWNRDELRFLSDTLMTMQEGFLLEQLFGTLDDNL